MTKYQSKWHVKQMILELFPEVTSNIQVISESTFSWGDFGGYMNVLQTENV